MPVALPGFVDTGVTKSLSVTCRVRFQMDGHMPGQVKLFGWEIGTNYASNVGGQPLGSMPGADASTLISSSSYPTAQNLQAMLMDSIGEGLGPTIIYPNVFNSAAHATTVDVVIVSLDNNPPLDMLGNPVPPGSGGAVPARWSPWFDASLTVTGMRLGVRLTTASHPTEVVGYSQRFDTIEYGWFRDENTMATGSVGPASSTQVFSGGFSQPFTATPPGGPALMGPLLDMFYVEFDYPTTSGGATESMCQIDTIVCSDVTADTSACTGGGLAGNITDIWHPMGGNGLEYITTSTTGNNTAAVAIGAPYDLYYSLNLQAAGMKNSDARIADSYICGDTDTPTATDFGSGLYRFKIQRVNWPTPGKKNPFSTPITVGFNYTQAWLTGHDPVLDNGNSLDSMGDPVFPLLPVLESHYEVPGIRCAPALTSPAMPKIVQTGSFSYSGGCSIPLSAGAGLVVDVPCSFSASVAVTNVDPDNASVSGTVSGTVGGWWSFTGTITGGVTQGGGANLSATVTSSFVTGTPPAAGLTGNGFSGGGVEAVYGSMTTGSSSAVVNLTGFGAAAVAGGLSVTCSSGPLAGSTINCGYAQEQQSYNPLSFTVASTLDIHRPDMAGAGLPSAYVASGGGVTVTEGATDTTFAVSSHTDTATRTLVSNSTNYLTSGDPLFNLFTIPPSYAITKHNYGAVTGEDIWWWNTYPSLHQSWTPDATVDCTVTMTIHHTPITISDSHETSSTARNAAFSATGTPTTTVWTFSLPHGSSPIDVVHDLIFPPAGGPFYLGRVSAIEFSFSANGTYILHSNELSADGNQRWKVGFGAPRPIEQGGADYSVGGGSIGGSWVFGDIPDQDMRTEEIGATGADWPYALRVVGTGTGMRFDSIMSLSDFWAQPNAVEGITATYSSALYLAAMQDAFGNSLPESSQWLAPTMPYNSSPRLDCMPYVRNVIPVTGLPFLLYVEEVQGGAMEVMAHTAGNTRYTAGAKASAVRDDTMAVVATLSEGITDPYGWGCIGPIVGNGNLTYSVINGTGGVALTWRDLVRRAVEITTTSGKASPDLLETEDGQLYLIAIRLIAGARDVYCWRSDTTRPGAGMTWDMGPAQVTFSGMAIECRIEQDSRGQLVVLYADAGGAYRVTSTDRGQTWSTNTMAIPDAKHVTIANRADGLMMIEAGVIDAGGGDFNINAHTRWAGEDWGTVFTIQSSGVPLDVADDDIAIRQAFDESGRWLIGYVPNGTTDSALAVSIDACKTCTPL